MNRVTAWHFTDVPGLGTVLISPDAVAKLREDDVIDTEILAALEHGTDVWARADHWVMGRQYRDIRLVIKTYSERDYAAVCVNGYRVKP